MEIGKWLVIDHQNQRYRLVREDDLFSLQEQLGKYTTEKSVWDLLLEAKTEDFGSKFRQLRESKAIEVYQIEEKSGLKEPNIRNIELGHRSPRPNTRIKLVNALRQLIESLGL